MQIQGASYIHSPQSINTPHARGLNGADAANRPASITDSLDISEAGSLAARMGEIPDVRADRVAQIKAAIASGSYETSDKLSVALDRLLDEIG